MLADQEHPVEDAIADPAPPGPKVVVVYRTRGIPWLFLPPLLLLAGVAAIVVYRRSERPEPWPPLATRESQPAPIPPAEPRQGTPPPDDGRVRLDGLAELAQLTGRPVALPPTDSTSEGPRYDQTPPAPLPAPVEAKTPTPPEATIAKPAPVEAAPVVKPEPIAAQPAPSPAPVARLDPSKPGPSPFDPLVTDPARVTPVPPPALAEPIRRDAVGFDPEARRVVLDEGPKPAADHAVAEKPAAPAPEAEPPLALDPRPDNAARRAQRTREAMLDSQEEAERRLERRLRLEAIKDDILVVDAADRGRRRADFVAMVRRLTAQDRPAFHADLRQALRTFGRGAGPEIRAIRDRYGVDCVPEIAMPANRDLVGPAAHLTLPERINRMRRWGLPETMILDDLYEHQHLNMGGREGARNEDEAWAFAARVLLSYPPASLRVPAPAPPASLAR